MKEETRQHKYIYIEFIRIFAIFWVIYNHTGQHGFYLFSTKEPGSISFWLYLFVSVFCKVAVPLFLCVSGALLLGKTDEGLKQLWKKRISIMLIILVFFSAIYYMNYSFYTTGDIDIYMLLKLLYAGPLPAYGHLWYLYAYIVFLILLPFLNALVSKLENQYYYYMIAIVICLNICKAVEYIIWNGDVALFGEVYDNVWINIDIVLYPCIGYFLHHRLNYENIGKKIPFLWLINIVGILVSCIMVYFEGQAAGGFSEWNQLQFINNFVVINCITLFITIRYIFEKVSFPDFCNRIIVSIGKTTFGIYLIHLLVKHYLTEKRFIPMLIECSINSMIAVLLYCFGIMVVSYIIITIFLKVPYIKKLVGGK